jgi:hypothetical protein
VLDPPVLLYSKKYPRIAEFTLVQNSRLPPETFSNSVVVSKYVTLSGDHLKFFTKVYSKGSISADNLQLFEIGDAVRAQDTFLLTTPMRTILSGVDVEFVVLDAGSAVTSQPSCRGYYIGSFVLSKNSNPIAVGNASGYLAYDGKVLIEFDNPLELHFLNGRSIEINDTTMIFTADVLSVSGESLEKVADTLRFNPESEELLATIPLTLTSYDTLRFKILLQQ